MDGALNPLDGLVKVYAWTGPAKGKHPETVTSREASSPRRNMDSLPE